MNIENIIYQNYVLDISFLNIYENNFKESSASSNIKSLNSFTPDPNIGFEDDKLFLLSRDNYQKYHMKIYPYINTSFAPEQYWTRDTLTSYNSYSKSEEKTTFAYYINDPMRKSTYDLHCELGLVICLIASYLDNKYTDHPDDYYYLDKYNHQWFCIDSKNKLLMREIIDDLFTTLQFNRNGKTTNYRDSDLRKYLNSFTNDDFKIIKVEPF